MHIKVYRPSGETRAIWSKPFAAASRRNNVMPVRGSHVIAITDGLHRGKFHVDFSPLADATGDDAHCVCLAETFESHEEAVAAEHRWLLDNWVCA